MTCHVDDTTTLLAPDGTPADAFGFSVGLDGDTAIIGACIDDHNGPETGSAYVFVRKGDRWVEQAKLLPSDPTDYAWFGISVAVSGDLAVVGAVSHHHQFPEEEAGAVYVFTRIAGEWTQSAKLVPHDSHEQDAFGGSVAISDDTLIVGAINSKYLGIVTGAVYVFQKISGTWIETNKIVAGDAQQGQAFGWSVGLDSDTAIIGAPFDRKKDTHAGAAYVFRRVRNQWQQECKLTSNAAFALFGHSVAISGEAIIVGAPRDIPEQTYAGTARMYVREGDDWVATGTLHASDARRFDHFGTSVAIRDNLAIVGAPGDYVSGEHPGWAYVFRHDGEAWTEIAKVVAPDGAGNDFFGYAVAIDGHVALVGAYADSNENGEFAGGLYAIDLVCGIPGDADANGCVDGFDLALLLGEWGANPGSPADFVDSGTFQTPPDGTVDGADLAVLLGAWGPCD